MRACVRVCGVRRGTYIEGQGTFFAMAIDALNAPVRYGSHTRTLQVDFRPGASNLLPTNYCGIPEHAGDCDKAGDLADRLRTSWHTEAVVVTGTVPLARPQISRKIVHSLGEENVLASRPCSCRPDTHTSRVHCMHGQIQPANAHTAPHRPPTRP